ncbi:asparagine synthase (glutamine-hydrolyzing) [Candidatus Uhrbacteria bacterium]|nr:asparagine synthase (glutamine-hydrolyzing) [Candidatus Uhrbacteria bacterium]
MCGIAGIIGTREDVTRERLQSLASSLAHRGPDDEGVEMLTSGGAHAVGFVHRRLAIIDLTPAGHQPMRDPETGNWITFNGEIYNYRELRKSLAACGATFRTGSDTEVILKAYAQYGRSCVNHLDGMFACAIWDAATERLLLAVDRIGVKPLYWRHDAAGRFAFASEARSFLASGLATRRIDHAAVMSYLALGSVQAPRTILAGVSQLLPAHTLVFDARTGAVSIERYWSPSQRGVPSSPAEIASVLASAVARHLVSDVPVGLFLSGGVDSSALAVLAHHVGAGETIESFTVTFPEAPYAEGAYARLVGERYCRRHHELVIRDADLAAALPAALAAQDQPSIDGTNVYVISQAVRAAGMKVILSGQGGDEVFGGYPTFRRLPRMVAAHRFVTATPWSVRRGLAWGARAWAGAAPVTAKVAAYLTSSGDAMACYAIARQLFHPDVCRQLLSGVRSEADHAWSSATGVAEELAGLDAARTVSLLELRGYLANTLLRDSDVMSMAHGLEVRVPYLDRALVESVFRAPASAFSDATLPKPLLLRAVQAELPREIYERKKMGFTFPWESWLRGRLRPQIEELLQAFPEDNALGINVSACRQLWSQFWSGRGGVTWARPWALHALMSWVQHQGMI